MINIYRIIIIIYIIVYIIFELLIFSIIFYVQLKTNSYRITADHSAAATLGKEARRWSTRIAREINSIRENNRKLQVLLQLKESGQKVNKQLIITQIN